MIKALVVDDERMVRRGFQLLTDWKMYNIEFVGEARDGVQALQLLAALPVDMMFVDITMPTMNGFELMRHVQEQYPQIKVVILTCHHEFDYVQEALQLGAIDYIVKTLLNRDNIDETMTRIMKRIERDHLSIKHNTSQFTGGSYLFCLDEQPTSWLTTFLSTNKITQLNKMWYRMPSDDRSSLIDHVTEGNYCIVHIKECKQLNRNQIEEWLQNFGEQFIFYSCNEQLGNIILTEDQLTLWMSRLQQISKEQLHVFIEETEQFRWLIYPQAWNQWIDDIYQLYPPPKYIKQLCHYLYHPLLTINWEQDRAAFVHELSNQLYFAVIENELRQLSLMIRSRMGDLSFSHEVMQCMIKVIPLMQKQLSSEITQNDLAHQVGMSRSYFSQCFKRLYGVSFSDVLRQLRIEKAKKKLVTTQLSIVEIANSVGFIDHKYFSRTFKMVVGQYPTEYRSLYYELR